MKTGRRWTIGTMAAAAAMVALGGCDAMEEWGGEDETPMALADMPAPVRQAILARTTEANITQLSSEMEAGRMVYEVEYTADGIKREAEFDASGALLEESDDAG